MKNMRFIFPLFLFLSTTTVWGQDDFILDSILKSKTQFIPALNEKVSISVSNSSFQEFMRGVANSSGLNIDVNPDINIKVVNNFSNVTVLDMLVFLSKEYNLDVEVIGNIITVSQTISSPQPKIRIEYNASNEKISLDIEDEDLFITAKHITDKTGKNVVAKLNVRNEKIRCYIKDMPFDHAIENLALANGLNLNISKDGFYVIDKTDEKVAQNDFNNTNTNSLRSRNSRSNNRNQNNRSSEGDYGLDIRIIQKDSLLIVADNAPVPDILKALSQKTFFHYFVSPELSDRVSGNFSGSNINELLTYLLNGTKLTHRIIDNVYVVGEKQTLDYNEHAVIQLQNRSIDKLVEYIPTDLKEGVEIIEFTEMNSLFVSGPEYQIQEFQEFINKVDQVVPVILIEVIIMYVNKTSSVSTGIQAGLRDAPTSTGGEVFPGVDLTIGAGKINEILNGLGWINLGNVTPNFFLTVEAMESQGFLEIESTPKLSTLNGHEATMSIGNTEYYLEERVDIIGTQNPTQTKSQQYKSVNADLSIKIRPVMSGDEQITLEIEVAQSTFTGKISDTAPPGTVNREFTSMIRMKNQEMVLLGGLMEKETSDSGSGTPLLSRLPIIKWFFSSRKHEDSDSKLSLLIRPTIIN